MAMFNRIECPTRIGLGFWMEQGSTLEDSSEGTDSKPRGKPVQPRRGGRTASGVVKRVIDLDTGEIYESAAAASEVVGCKPDNIMLVCRGKAWTAKGKRWAYLGSEGQPLLHLLPKGTKSTGKPARRIRELTTGRTFDTLGQAAKALGLSKSSLSHYLSGRQETLKGGYKIEEI